MHVAIITAMPEETRAILSIAEHVESARLEGSKAFSCRIAGHDVILVESGMGFDNAAAAAETLLRERRPDILISTGFCGGVSPELRVGDVVVATKLFIIAKGAIQEVPVEVPSACLNFIARQSAQGARVFGGLFAGTPSMVSKKQLATLLPSDAHSPVVEMESAAIAIVAVENGISFAGIRSISDPAGEELNFTLEEFSDSSMRIRPHKVILTVMRKPWIIPQLTRLARNSAVAAKTLSQALKQFLEIL